MSNIPDGALLPSIEGTRCTAMPRNVTDSYGPMVTTRLSFAATSEASTKRPPGDILMEAPASTDEFLSMASSPTTSVRDAEASADTDFSIQSMYGSIPKDVNEPEEGSDWVQSEEPLEAVPEPSDSPQETQVLDQSDLGEDRDVESTSPTPDVSGEGITALDSPGGVDGEGRSDSATATPGGGVVTLSAAAAQTTDERSEKEVEDGDDDSLGTGESGSEETEDHDDGDDGDDATKTGNEQDDGSWGDASVVPSKTGEVSITETLGRGRGSPTASTNSGLGDPGEDNGGHTRQAGIITGSVIGSFVAVALISALVFWFWKRSQRHRYTIPTPVFDRPRTEKAWHFDNASIGPTNKALRVKGAVEARLCAIKQTFTKSPLQLNSSFGTNTTTENSRYFAAGALSPASRGDPDIRPDNAELPSQDGDTIWWSRGNKGDVNFNRAARGGASEPNPISALSRQAYARPVRTQDIAGVSGLGIADADERRDDPFSDKHSAPYHPKPTIGYAVHRTPPLHNPFDDTNSVKPLALVSATHSPQGLQRRSTSDPELDLAPMPLRLPSSASHQRRHEPTSPFTYQRTHTSPQTRGAVQSDQFDLELEPHPGTLVVVPAEVSSREDTTREGSLRSFTSSVVSACSGGDEDSGGSRMGGSGIAALWWLDARSPGIGRAE